MWPLRYYHLTIVSFSNERGVTSPSKLYEIECYRKVSNHSQNVLWKTSWTVFVHKRKRIVKSSWINTRYDITFWHFIIILLIPNISSNCAPNLICNRITHFCFLLILYINRITLNSVSIWLSSVLMIQTWIHIQHEIISLACVTGNDNPPTTSLFIFFMSICKPAI